MIELEEKRLRVDSHVHFHECFEEGPFLDAAASSLLGDSADVDGVLCMNESMKDDWFGRLKQLPQDAQVGETAWRIQETAEHNSVVLRDDRERALTVIAGRQIVCREGLEVGGIGVADIPDDGQPIREMLEYTAGKGAVTVLPWGFGKWTGNRGTLVASILDDPPCRIALGDNGGRLAGFSEPALFEVARKKGLPILPGTDPFPFRWDTTRVGSFGIEWRGTLDEARPFESLKKIIWDSGQSGEAFGRLERLPSFIRNQVAIQMRRLPGVFN